MSYNVISNELIYCSVQSLESSTKTENLLKIRKLAVRLYMTNMKESLPKDELLVSGQLWEDPRSLWELLVDEKNRQMICKTEGIEPLGFKANRLQKWQAEMVKNLTDPVRFSAW